MTTVVDRPCTRRAQVSPAQRLRDSMAAVRVSFEWFGLRKSLSLEQKAQAAESFGAEGQFLTAGKKLLDSRHPAYKEVTSVRSRIQSCWRDLTLPFPEPGIRLIRQRDVSPFDQRLTALSNELDTAVANLDEHYAELRVAARTRLGALYSDSDYPLSLRGLFAVSWDWPSVEPPNYLRELSPELYEQEAERVRARFEEAVKLAEQAFVEELSRLVSHLTERLSGTDDGRRKVFRDSAVENLTEFFERFRRLNIGSDEQLDQLVEQAQQLLRGVEPQQLRTAATLRTEVARGLSGIQATLDGLLVTRPRRQVLRPPR